VSNSIHLAIATQKAHLCCWGLDRSSIVGGSIFNSKGIHVAVVSGSEIFDLTGKKLYNIKGVNIYRPSGELVGHLNDAKGSDKRLDRSTDRLFPSHSPFPSKAEGEARGTRTVLPGRTLDE
jgi:hypothetical protein